MNNNETQLLNSVLAIAALSANISPEELKEYVNALSVDSSKVRSDDRFNDAHPSQCRWTASCVP